MARRRAESEVLPLREELESLVHTYNHLRNENKRAAPESSVRRHIEGRMLAVRERFERLLSEWVSDEELQHTWQAHLENRGPAPAEPTAVQPLLFRGVSDAGSIAEIRGSGEELEVRVDGALIERIAGEKDFAVTGPPVHFRLNGTEFRETFAASPEALEALAASLDGSSPPPWEHSAELLADGLIDAHFALKPRGRRALHAR